MLTRQILAERRGRAWRVCAVGSVEEFEARNEGDYWSLYSRLPGENWEAVGSAPTRTELFEEIERRYSKG